MDVLEQTATRLVIQDKTVLGYWRGACLYTVGTAVVFGIVAAPFTWSGLEGIRSILIYEQKATLTCDRTQPPAGVCQLVRSRLIGKQITKISLDDLQNATAQNWESRQRPPNSNSQVNKATVDGVYLNTSTGSIRLTTKSLNITPDAETEHQAIAEQINTFLENPVQPSLKVEHRGSDSHFLWVMLIISLLCLIPVIVPLLLMSAVSLYLLRSTTCTLDKTLGTLTIRHQGAKLFGSIEFFEPKVIECALEEIADIQVKEFSKINQYWNLTEGSQGWQELEAGTIKYANKEIFNIQEKASSGNSQYWNLVAILKTKKYLPLLWMGTLGKEEKQIMAHRIRQFLNLM